jgi:ubiquinone/menaquinone biosynthesis C-methylase UbiE
MTKQKVNIKELSYYDFLAHIGISFFNWGGSKATEELVEMCKIDENKKVLVVGCGNGYGACYIAEKYGCKVIGIDIAEIMINKAKERAKDLNLENKVEFQYGDAIDIPYHDNSFDIVITEFVTIFVDNKKKAFTEYARVVVPGGFIGINEIFKSNNIPIETAEKLKEMEDIYKEVTSLDFSILTPNEWKNFFKELSLIDIFLVEKPPSQDVKEMVSSVGGKWKFLKISFKVLYYTMTKGPLGKKLRGVGKVKSIIRANRGYIGYLLCVGRKPK